MSIRYVRDNEGVEYVLPPRMPAFRHLAFAAALCFGALTVAAVVAAFKISHAVSGLPDADYVDIGCVLGVGYCLGLTLIALALAYVREDS